jgi:hypothetical protein
VHTLRLVLNGTSGVSSRRLAKRSRALRGRNPARDSQADRAPTARAPPLTRIAGPPSSPASRTREPCLTKSRGLGRSPSNHPLAHRFCGRAEKKGRRLRVVLRAREADRALSPAIPTALGEAVPHGEAWLLDDAVAVRAALNLPADTPIPTVRRSQNPKRTLHELLANSPRTGDRPLEVLADIARQLEPSRCTHGKKTGFHGFVGEVREESGPLVAETDPGIQGV